MGLTDPSSGLTRIESARNAVGRILDDALGDEEWALIAVSDKSKIEVLVPVTRSAREIRSALQRRKPWGTTPLSEALRTSLSYLKTATRAPVGAVVLLSDCMSTEGDFSAQSIAGLFHDAGTRLFIVGFPIEDNPDLLAQPAELANASQGGFYFPEDVDALSLRLHVMFPRTVPSSIPAEPAEGAVEAARARPAAPATPTYASSALPLTVLWGLVAAGVILMALLLRAVLFPSPQAEPARIGVFHFEVLSPPKERRLVSLKNESVRIGSEPDCDLCIGGGDMPAAMKAHGRVEKASTAGMGRAVTGSLTVGFEDGMATLRCETGVLINGVVRHDKKLKEGDLIRFDGARIAYRGLDLEDVEIPSRPRGFPRLMVCGAGLAVALLLAVFFTLRAGAAAVAAPGAAAVAAPGAAAVAAPGAAAIAAPGAAAVAAPAPAVATAPAVSDPLPRSDPFLFAPGEDVPVVKADVLLIHAHPDDECIDFGCLIAKASRSGKTVIQVTLTDGESGLDNHEERDGNHVLPEKSLAGRELAAIRVQEERNALSLLGARGYVRLGLQNHPYNTSAQVLSKSQLLVDWGGESAVVGRIVALLETLQPEVVVSPDRRSAAREHFEHETTGDLVRTAIATVQRRGRFPLKGYVVSVDPRQRSSYRGLVTVDGMTKDPLTGLPLRDIQSQALAEHMTQRDASVIGREVLAGFRNEYYLPVFWKIPESLDEWLSE